MKLIMKSCYLMTCFLLKIVLDWGSNYPLKSCKILTKFLICAYHLSLQKFGKLPRNFWEETYMNLTLVLVVSLLELSQVEKDLYLQNKKKQDEAILPLWMILLLFLTE